MNLFKFGSFKSAGGLQLDWKIECDALTPEDWECLARIALPNIGLFSNVISPGGAGQKFADALDQFKSHEGGPLLIADDVWTTGKSVVGLAERTVGLQGYWKGVVVFARTPPWPEVKALFNLGAGFGT
jgi:hypothetical protein